MKQFIGKQRWRQLALVFLILLGVLMARLPLRATPLPAQLTMGTSADYKPFAFYETTSGKEEIVGFDVDVAKHIARQLGFDLKIVDMDFNGLIPALQAKRVDFVLAGMTPTPERRQNVDFSELYYEARDTIVTEQGSPLTTLASLEGKTLGVQLGSTQQQVADKITNAKVRVYNRIPDLIQEVKARRIDAALIEESVAAGYIQAFPDLAFNVLPESSGGYAIAFAKGSPLVEPFNRVITDMKTDGTLTTLIQKWLTDADTPQRSGWQQIARSIPYILGGIPVTLAFTAVSALCGFIWGVVLVLAKIAKWKPLRWLAAAYTSVFRGTPLIVQIALVYFATPQLTGYDIPAFQAGVIAFTLNSGAYTSETLRGGILAVDRGQWEAASSLGVSYWLMMQDIIMPQAIKNILPALANELINLLKDSALVSTIGAADLLRRANVVGAETYLYFEPLILVGAIYYGMVMVLTFIAGRLEERMHRSA